MTQQWSASAYERNGAFVAALGEPVVALLAPRAGERILDLGCGNGVLTARILAAGAIVVEIDTAPDMLTAARERGIDARALDGRSLPFERDFEAVFSNAALHWMDPPDAVLDGVARALVDGGRFVGEFGAHGNVAAICTALLATRAALGKPVPPRLPWFFPTPDDFAARLRACGFAVDDVRSLPRPTPLPTGMRAWLETFATPFLIDVDGAERNAMLDEAVRLLAPSLRDGAGGWTADYVRLRFVARLVQRA